GLRERPGQPASAAYPLDAHVVRRRAGVGVEIEISQSEPKGRPRHPDVNIEVAGHGGNDRVLGARDLLSWRPTRIDGPGDASHIPVGVSVPPIAPHQHWALRRVPARITPCGPEGLA